MNMRLLGAKTLKDVVPEMVDASNIHTHIVSVPGDVLYDRNCEPSIIPCAKCPFAEMLTIDVAMEHAKLRGIPNPKL
jgi:hypothetical protein